MEENQHHPDRKDFQIDRMILFTDAVFAIAITLLVIDIKVPTLAEKATEHDFWLSMLKLLPKFIGFVVSFFFIGLYWFLHHKLFGYVINYTNKLIWLNILFLFSIVLIPFSTSVYSEFSTDEHIRLVGPYMIYTLNICLAGIMHYLLLRYVYNRKNNVATHLPDTYTQVSSLRRAIMIPIVFLISLGLTFIFPEYGRMFLFTIPFFTRLFRPKKPIPHKKREHI